MKKEITLAPEDIKDIAVGHGSCVATDMITVYDRPVGLMYRDEPSDTNSSGWCFLWGWESEDYMNDPDNQDTYDINIIANYSPDVIEFLQAPVGSAFERNAQGKLVAIKQ